MIPTASTDQTQLNTTDDSPRFFLDDTYDANLDSDWWLDLGRIDLPTAPGV
jgi:hypothetical protein